MTSGKANMFQAAPKDTTQKQNDFLQQLGQKISDFFSSVFSHIGTGGTAAVLAVIVAVLLWLVIRAWRRMSGGRKASADIWRATC